MRDNMTVEIRRMSASALAATDAESSPEARAECLERALHRISDIDEEIFPGNVWGLKAYSDSTVHDYDHLIAAFAKTDAKDEALIGFALLRCFDDAELIRIAVDKSFRRQGVGRKLLDELITETKNRNIKDIFLEVRIGNDPAVSMYRAAGFTDAGVRKNYYSEPKEDALIMRYTC